MLFDLQSPRRKRVVQVVFGALAVLFAVSFVFLGIGTGISGSPLEAIGIGGADDPAEQFQDQIDDQEAKVDANPADKAALIELINLRYQAANQKYELDEETGATSLTPEAEEELERAADTWDQYLKAAGKQPDSSAGLIAVQVFSALAQGQLQQAATGSGQAALDTADESLTNWTNAGAAQLVVAAAGLADPEGPGGGVLLLRRRHRQGPAGRVRGDRGGAGRPGRRPPEAPRRGRRSRASS